MSAGDENLHQAPSIAAAPEQDVAAQAPTLGRKRTIRKRKSACELLTTLPANVEEVRERKELIQELLCNAADSVAGWIVRCPVVWMVVGHVSVGAVCIAVCVLAAPEPSVTRFTQKDSYDTIYQDVFREAWLNSAYAPRYQQRDASGALLDYIPTEELFGPFYTAGAGVNISNVTGSRRSNAGAGEWIHFPVQLIYSHDGGLLGGGSVLTELSLYAIGQFEKQLRQGPLWQQLCASSFFANSSSCNPGESLVNHVWPEGADGIGASAVTQPLHLTGTGNQWLPVEWALSAIGASGTTEGGEVLERLKRFLPEDFVLPPYGQEAFSLTLRSHFLFSIPLGPGMPYSKADDATKAFQRLLSEELSLAITAAQANTSSNLLGAQGLSVYLRNDEQTRADTISLLGADFGLALLVVAPALLLQLWRFVYSKRGSFLLAFFGLLIQLESLPLGCGLTMLIMGRNVSVVMTFSLFIMPWLGVDVILFDILEGWKVSQQECELPVGTRELVPPKLSDMKLRLKWLWASRISSNATFLLCVVSSFFACLCGGAAPFREAALLLGLTLTLNFILSALLFPLALIASENGSLRLCCCRRGLQNDVTEAHLTDTDEDTALHEAIVPSQPTLAEIVSEKSQESRKKTWKTSSLRARVSSCCGRLVQLWRYANSLDDPTSLSFSAQFGEISVRRMAAYRFILAAIFALVALIASIVVGLVAQVDGADPNLFSSLHPEAIGRSLSSGFAVAAPFASSPFAQAPLLCEPPETRDSDDVSAGTAPNATSTCVDTDVRCGAWTSMGLCLMNQSQAASRCPRSCGTCRFCLLNHCRTMEPPADGPSSSSKCSCFQKKGSARTNPTLTVVGVAEEDWLKLQPDIVAGLGFLNAVNATIRQTQLVQEHWRSGRSVIWPTFSTRLNSTSSSPAILCYCGGAKPCASSSALQALNTISTGLKTFQSLQPIKIDPAKRSIAYSLFSRDVNRVVSVIWGVSVQKPLPVAIFPRATPAERWSFDSLFDMADPWVQRDVMRMCTNLPSELQASLEDPGGLWPQVFEKWLSANGEDFPSRDFNTRLSQFLQIFGAYRKDLLFRGGIAKAVRLGFMLRDIPNGWTTNIIQLQAVKKEWDQHLVDMNAKSGYKSSRAWHTSLMWGDLAARDGTLACIRWSLMLMVLLGFLLGAIIVKGVTLSCTAMLSLFSAVLIQCMFLSAFLGWKLGVMEAIALVMYAGFTLHLLLRVALAYATTPSEHQTSWVAPPCTPKQPSTTTLATPAVSALQTPIAGGSLSASVSYNLPPSSIATPRDGCSIELPSGVAIEDSAVVYGHLEIGAGISTPSTELQDRVFADRKRRVQYALEVSFVSVISSSAFGVFVGIIMVMPAGFFGVRSRPGVALISACFIGSAHALMVLPVLLLLFGPTTFATEWWKIQVSRCADSVARLRKSWRSKKADEAATPTVETQSPSSETEQALCLTDGRESKESSAEKSALPATARVPIASEQLLGLGSEAQNPVQEDAVPSDDKLQVGDAPMVPTTTFNPRTEDANKETVGGEEGQGFGSDARLAQ